VTIFNSYRQYIVQRNSKYITSQIPLFRTIAFQCDKHESVPSLMEPEDLQTRQNNGSNCLAIQTHRVARPSSAASETERPARFQKGGKCEKYDA